MPYLNETGLSYYNGLLKPWIAAQGVKDAPSELFNFQQTAKAGAVTLWPVGGTPLAPVVDYIFTETPPSNGQPKAPDNPSTITGVSQAVVTRCGKNLLKFPYSSSSETISDVAFSVASDGTVTANGTASSDAFFYIAYIASGPWLVSGLTYSISGCPSGGSTNTYYLRHQSYTSSGEIDTGSGGFFTANATGRNGNICIVIKSGTTVSNLVFKPQLELGSTATSFEPYAGTDYTIPLGGTYYGGSIDLATGTMTVTHWGHAFDGTETTNAFTVLGANGRATYFLGTLKAKNATSQTCTHLPLLANYTSDTTHFYVNFSGINTGCVLFAPYLTQTTFSNWLATEYANGTPVTIACELATPYTVQLSPTEILSLAQTDKYTPRLNTIYSDQQAVQVGYVKSPIRDEFELQQAVVGLGGNV